MRTVTVAGAGFGPVTASQPSGFVERFLGLQASTSLPALLIDSSSVHTFGMDRPIGIVGLDTDMEVMATRVVNPNRIVWLRGVSRILEVPAEIPLPETGTKLGLVGDG